MQKHLRTIIKLNIYILCARIYYIFNGTANAKNERYAKKKYEMKETN